MVNISDLCFTKNSNFCFQTGLLDCKIFLTWKTRVEGMKIFLRILRVLTMSSEWREKSFKIQTMLLQCTSSYEILIKIFFNPHRFVVGFAAGGSIITNHVFTMEFLTKKHRLWLTYIGRKFGRNHRNCRLWSFCFQLLGSTWYSSASVTEPRIGGN